MPAVGDNIAGRACARWTVTRPLGRHIGDRFIVKADTRGLGEGAAGKIVEKMDLKGLAAKGS